MSLSLQHLNVLCSSPFGKNKEFRYNDLKAAVTASLASTVTNVQDAMAIVLRVIKNKDMSTHTLFSMMDTSKKVPFQLCLFLPFAYCLLFRAASIAANLSAA